ncbi:MAG: hypothetical protein QW587_05230 [Candidatus Bathyarchaeia archaeon]
MNSINDLRRVLGGLRKLDQATATKTASLVDELKVQHAGKALYRQIDDIGRNPFSVAVYVSRRELSVAFKAMSRGC